MKKIILGLVFLLILPLSNSFARDQYISGEGRFFAQETDSLEFVKKQLLFSAFRDVISKELKTMGLDNTFFWNQYDLKFEEYFTPIKEKLKLTYKIDDEGVSKKQREAYQKTLRAKKLKLKSRFGRLARAINSYSIRSMSRSTQMANSRYLKLQAKIDKQVLNQLYIKFTRTSESRHFKNVFLTVDFKLKDLTWTDLGVDIQSDFTNVITEHWKRWLTDNYKPYVEEIILTDEEQKNKLLNFVRIPQDTTQTIHSYTSNGEAKESANETSYIRVEEDALRDSLWLKITLSIKKRDEDTLLKKREFEVGGEFILIDLKNNQMAHHFDFISESNTYSYEKSQELSSSLASLIYSMPLNELKKVQKNLGHMPANRNSINLEIYNLDSIGQLFKMKKLIQNKGVTLLLNPTIKKFNRDIAIVNLDFQGDSTRLKEMLQKLENTAVGNSILGFKSEDNPFQMVLKAKVKEVPNKVPMEKTKVNKAKKAVGPGNV
jgi:hypothetical protein